MMIQNKELNKAFEVALTATDLHLVLFVCNKVNYLMLIHLACHNQCCCH